ncbi:MAG: hypothetical protein Kow00121_49690 [Elainellaceae cyanobacterium]
MTVLCVLTQFVLPICAYADTPVSIGDNQTIAITKIVDLSKQLQAPKLRGQHPKSHGTVWAEFTVAPDLPENLRVGVFQQPEKTYPAWIRFSNGSAMDDTQGGLHGMAIKLTGVEGDKVLESEKAAKTQDFVMGDHPVFFMRNAKEFAGFFAALAENKGKLPVEFFLPDRTQELKILQAFQQKQINNPLGATYWSQTPYQFGNQAIKFAVKPTHQISAEMGTTRDYLRSSLVDYLKNQDATFDFLIQLQGDTEKTPIEDPTVEWTEQNAPLQKVATIRIPRQVFDTLEQNAFGEALSFTPWHSLPEHQPLGSINLARKAVYQATSEQRHQEMGIAMEEPTPDSFTPHLLNL